MVSPITALAEATKAYRKDRTDISTGKVRDSQSMGQIESPIRWWEAKTRTFRYDMQLRCGVLLSADDEIWPWLTRHAAWSTSVYRIRGGGHSSHYAAFGVEYMGEIVPFAETIMARLPMTTARSVGKKAGQARLMKGDSTMIKGIWVGKSEGGRRAHRVNTIGSYVGENRSPAGTRTSGGQGIARERKGSSVGSAYETVSTRTPSARPYRYACATTRRSAS